MLGLRNWSGLRRVYRTGAWADQGKVAADGRAGGIRRDAGSCALPSAALSAALGGAAGARFSKALEPRAALMALIENSLWLHSGETAGLASDMACFARLVRSIPIYPLSVEVSPGGIAAVGRHIGRMLLGAPDAV